jgi:hypothetical protein
MGRIDDWLSELASITEEVKELTDEKKALQNKIITFLEDNESSTVEWELDGRPSKATVVYSSVLKFDEEGLADALSTHLWNSVSSRKLDQKKLEDKIARGSIDATLVAEHSDEVPRTPYIKISHPNSGR